MKVYIYRSHCGEFYVLDVYHGTDELYCQICHDCDELLLVAESIEEVRDFLAEKALFKSRVYTAERCKEILKDCEELFDEESERK